VACRPSRSFSFDVINGAIDIDIFDINTINTWYLKSLTMSTVCFDIYFANLIKYNISFFLIQMQSKHL